MKIIDRNGRLFGKVSILDVLAVLLVIVLAAALSFKGEQTHTGTGDSLTPITFQVTAMGVRDYVGDSIRVGDPFYDQDRTSGGALGIITAVDIQPGTKQAELNDGSLAIVPAEGCVNVVITVEGRGVLSGDRYLINRIYELGVNASRSFYTPYSLFVGSVTAILD